MNARDLMPANPLAAPPGTLRLIVPGIGGGTATSTAPRAASARRPPRA